MGVAVNTLPGIRRAHAPRDVAALRVYTCLALGACLTLSACAARSTVGTDAGGAASSMSAGGTSTCFPIETLSPADRVVADRVLLEFADREGLYTLAGGLKPVSSDVRDLAFRIAPTLDTSALQRIEQLRRVSAALTCGELMMFAQIFTATSPGRENDTMRNATMVVVHRAALRALMARHSPYFSALGVTASSDPREVVSAVENAPRAERWRGYGLLFGYPDEAVAFFVRAGIEGDSTKKIVPRDFRRIETFHKFPESRGGPATVSSFVYAVPKGASDSPGDLQLRAKSAPIYARYIEQRARFVKPDSSGAVQLWRAWMAGPSTP